MYKTAAAGCQRRARVKQRSARLRRTSEHVCMGRRPYGAGRRPAWRGRASMHARGSIASAAGSGPFSALTNAEGLQTCSSVDKLYCVSSRADTSGRSASLRQTCSRSPSILHTALGCMPGGALHSTSGPCQGMAGPHTAAWCIRSLLLQHYMHDVRFRCRRHGHQVNHSE